MLLCMMVSARGAALERQPPRWPSCTSSSLSLWETVSSGQITILFKTFVWARIFGAVVYILTQPGGRLVEAQFPFWPSPLLVCVQHIRNAKSILKYQPSSSLLNKTRGKIPVLFLHLKLRPRKRRSKERKYNKERLREPPSTLLTNLLANL